MKVAIITGATAGLGREYISVLAEKTNVEEIWLVARRKERMDELAGEFSDKKKIVPIALDLTADNAVSELRKILEEKKPDVTYLVNNAGCGKLGELYGADPDSQTVMVDLNCRAMTALTCLVLPYMNKGAGVINVCSIASFAPNPNMTVYCSTKAYVMSFSRSLRFELKKRKINVLAVCPGPMRTEFLSIAGIEKGSSKTFDTLPYCDPKKVAIGSVKKSDKRKAVYTPRLFFKFYRVLAKLLPHSIVMHMSKT